MMICWVRFLFLIWTRCGITAAKAESTTTTQGRDTPDAPRGMMDGIGFHLSGAPPGKVL